MKTPPLSPLKTLALSLRLPLSLCLSLLTLSLGLFVGCDDGDNQVEDAPDMVILGGGIEGGIEGGVEGGTGADTGELYLTYTRIVTEEGETRGDLVAFHVAREDELVLNAGMSRDDIDCVSYGCALHPELSWVAWIKRDGPQGALWLAPIDQATKAVDIANKRQLSSAALSFQFTENFINFTEIKDSDANQGISVKRAPLEGGDAMEVDLVDANGGFTVARDDDLLITIKTTLSTMTLTLRRLMSGQIVELFTFGEEGGTGSEYSATGSPVTLAPTLDYVSAVTNSGFMWRLNILDINGGEPQSRDLFPVQNVEEACSADLPYTQVLGAPQFSTDAAHLYMLFGGDCSQRENPSANRRDYDIYRMSRDGSEPALNITRILAFNSWANHDIGSFAVTPDETKVAFTATRPNKSGIKAIWLQEISEGDETSQDPVTFDCSRDPNVSAQRDPAGQRRCEYIIYDVASGGTVEYRALRYTLAEGL